MFIKKIVISFVLAVMATSAIAEHASPSRRLIRGQVATGANRFLDEPLWFMDGGLGLASFSFVFAHNPDGDEALPLTSSSPRDTVLATGLDENFLAALGMSTADIESRYINRPYKDVQVTVNPFTGEKVSVPMALQAETGTVSRSGPLTDVTLADWLKGRGLMEIKCRRDGTAKIKTYLSGLIPGGVYTAWGLFSQDINGDGIDDILAPVPFGGVPNVIIPTSRGRAVFTRKLGYCPQEESNLQIIDITYHSDGNVYGGTVDFIQPGYPAFAVTHTHIAFPINATPVN